MSCSCDHEEHGHCDVHEHHEHDGHGENTLIIIRLILSALLLGTAVLLGLDGWYALAAFLIPYLIIGYDVLIESFENIIHGEVFGEAFLMVIATIGAFAIGEYPEAVAVMLFFQLGELIEDLASDRARDSIEDLMDIRPDRATVIRDGENIQTTPQEVHKGELLLVRPGERIPLDGIITEGSSSIDASALTGESLPEDRGPGDAVVSGTLNLTGVITVRSTSDYESSTVSRILELVHSSGSRKAQSERFITRFSKVYTPCVVISALVLAIIPPLVTGGNWAEWIRRALVFLVVSCPCALVISIPMSFFGGIGKASSRGILIKGSVYLERLAKMDTVVFDKTGTLTEGRLKVSDVITAGEIGKDSLLELCAAIESHSSHPVALCVRQAWAKTVDPGRLSGVQEIPGMGISATVDGQSCLAGNAKLMERFSVTHPEIVPGKTAIHLAREGLYLGCILIEDSLKSEARQAVEQLRALGVKQTMMLTGDNEGAAAQVAAQAGLDGFRAGLLPDDKVAQVESLLGPGSTVAFVGDGINDAPVLARADIGIAMGALGSDSAIESADVVLMDDRLSKLPEAIRLSRRTMTIVKQNIVFAIGVKMLILLLGMFGVAEMWPAVFADVGVMLLAVLNAMRILWSGRKEVR